MDAFNYKIGQKIKTDTSGVVADHAFLSHVTISKPVATDTDGILDGEETTTGAGAVAKVITTFLAQPDVPRNITATVAASTAGNIAAGDITIDGVDMNGTVIQENLTVTADTAATLTGNLAFAKVTKVTIPVQDGSGVTVDVGWGKKLGIPYKLTCAPNVILKLFNNAADTGAITADGTDLAKNVIALNGTPDGAKSVDLYIIV